MIKHPKFAAASDDAVAITIVDADNFDDWKSKQSAYVAAWADANRFSAKLSQVLIIPDASGAPAEVIAGYGTRASRARGRFHLAHLAQALPKGSYRLQGLPKDAAETEALGWLLAGYVFDRYKSAPGTEARLVPPQNVDAERLEAIAEGEFLTRDLINTPAADMGPSALEAACHALAQTHDATCTVTADAALLEANLPMIHAVGRAAADAPRLIDMSWGGQGPKLTLVGKGVCFDTGGLDLKPSTSMALMKKDMGGAATVLGLAHMIMRLQLPVQLRVLIPAVENSVAGNAFRPGDILTSRKGLTVEINNTDAEGRLVLADALALGAEAAPDLMISMATLTGAARVAVGPDLSPYYTDAPKHAAALDAAAQQVADPVWRMPFYEPYETMIEPGIADLDNAPSGGFAGSITAALFLRRFAGPAPYMHFDIYGWNPNATAARPKGAVGMGARAVLEALPEILGL